MGEVKNIEEITTFDRYHSKYKWQDTWSPFIPNWNAYEYFNFYEKKSYINTSWSDCCHPITNNEIKKLDYDYLLNKARPYPHKNSTFVDDNVIYIVFEQNKLDELKNRINEIKQTN